MLEWQLDGVQDLTLDVGQATHILPAHVGDLTCNTDGIYDVTLGFSVSLSPRLCLLSLCAPLRWGKLMTNTQK